MSGRGNTTDEDKMGGSTDGREMNRCLIRLEYQVLGGEMRQQRGKDTLKYLKFILEARESH